MHTILVENTKVFNITSSPAEIPQLSGAAIARPWKSGIGRAKSLRGDHEECKRYFRNRFFSPKWGRRWHRDKTSPFIPEREKQKNRKIEGEEGKLSSS